MTMWIVGTPHKNMQSYSRSRDCWFNVFPGSEPWIFTQ